MTTPKAKSGAVGAVEHVRDKLLTHAAMVKGRPVNEATLALLPSGEQCTALAEWLGAALPELESACAERRTRSQQRVGRRREKPPLRMWLVVEPVLEVPELQAWCPVSLHHDEAEAKRAAHRLGGGRKAVRAFVDFHVPTWESPTEPSSATCGEGRSQRADCRTAGSQQRVGSRTPEQEPSSARTTDAARSGVGGKDL